MSSYQTATALNVLPTSGIAVRTVNANVNEHLLRTYICQRTGQLDPDRWSLFKNSTTPPQRREFLVVFGMKTPQSLLKCVLSSSAQGSHHLRGPLRLIRRFP